jgi:hypothetical protein
VTPTAPLSLTLLTVASLVLVNVLAAQLILRVAYPASAWQFGWSFLLLLVVVTGFALERTVRRWRAYLRAARPGRST